VALPSCPLKSTDRKGRDTRKGYKKTYLSFLSFLSVGTERTERAERDFGTG